MLRVFNHSRVRIFLLFIFFLVAFGTIAFMQIEGWPLFHALYYTVAVVTTVGLGDLAPSHDLSRMLTMIYMILIIPSVLIAIDVAAESVMRREIDRHHKKHLAQASAKRAKKK